MALNVYGLIFYLNLIILEAFLMKLIKFIIMMLFLKGFKLKIFIILYNKLLLLFIMDSRFYLLINFFFNSKRNQNIKELKQCFRIF